jgi:hypothetical protein
MPWSTRSPVVIVVTPTSAPFSLLFPPPCGTQVEGSEEGSGLLVLQNSGGSLQALVFVTGIKQVEKAEKTQEFLHVSSGFKGACPK